MSNALVISAVTATLRKLIDDAMQPIVPGLAVTTQPLDKTREGSNANSNQINVYLYHTTVNTGWRNLDPPNRVKAGETGFPPLALNLYYLITAYGVGNNEVVANGLLGSAMGIMHDTPVLDPADLRVVLPPPNTPGDQIERIRVTFEPLSVEEISKLWAAFQTSYRLSAAYQVTVVLIDSLRPSKAALPVLRRGQDDKGVTTLTSFPSIDSVSVLEQKAGSQPMALPGNTLIIRGSNFQSGNMTVRVSHPRFTGTKDLTDGLSITETEVRVRFPTSPTTDWPAGYYSLGVAIKQPGSVNILYTSNEVPFALLPTITTLPVGPIARTGNPPGASINVVFSPQVWPEQRITLMLGDREIASPAHPNKIGTLAFIVPQATAGQFYVRLRVDGVDSSLLDPASPIPQFDNSKRVTIT